MSMRISTERANGIQAIFREEFRDVIKNTLVCDQFGKVINLPLNAGGNTIRIFNNRKLSKVTTDLTEGAAYTTQNDINLDYLTVSIEQYGAFTRISEEALRYIKGDEITNAKEALMVQAAESVDWRAMRQWAPRSLHIRADAVAANEQESGSVTSNGATTSFRDSARDEAADVWNGGYITWTAGVNKGQTFQVTDYQTTNDVVVIGAGTTAWLPSAMPQAPATGDTYLVTVGTGLAAADVIAQANVLRALGILNEFSAKRFTAGPAAGYFAMIVDHMTDIDFQNDADWINANQYIDVTNIKKGLVGKYGGFMVFQTNQPYRESVAGVQSDTGAVHNNLCFGKDAYLRTKVMGDAAGIRVHIRTPEQLNQEIPRYSSVGWDATTGFREYEGLHAVSIMTGATALHG